MMLLLMKTNVLFRPHHRELFKHGNTVTMTNTSEDKALRQTQRIDDLECQLAFQEHTINELNDALAQQQLLISKMQEQMQYLVSKLKSMEPSNMADASQEAPPPHY